MNNIKLGYIRVSSKEQNEIRQLDKMRKLGVEERYIFIDKLSGKDFNRPQYQAMKLVLREGDLIYIDALDRLGRDYDGVIREWKEITRSIGADIVVLENKALFDSRKFKQMGDMGKLMEDQFLSLLSYVASEERKKIRRRQREGLDLAKANGTILGRPPINLNSINKDQLELIKKNYPKWKAKQITAVKFMELLNLKKNTFYRIMKQYESGKQKIN